MAELQQCKTFNPHLLTRIIQLECNTVTNSQYSRRETIELNPVSADITELKMFWKKTFARLCH